MTNPHSSSLSWDDFDEVAAFVQARITEDRDRALRMYECKSRALKVLDESSERDPDQMAGLVMARVMAVAYKDHPDFKEAWDLG